MPSEQEAKTSAMTAHPLEARLIAYGLDQLPPDERDLIARHLDSCEACRARVENEKGTICTDPRSDSVAAPKVVSSGTAPAELVEHARYRIISPLGEGGMGVVFKAEHKLMGRLVALKVINRSLTANQQIVDRFLREVRAAAKLTHPNIVTAYDAEEANGLHFLAMEFVDGISLDRFVARQKGPLSATMACHFIRQAALGLQHAHQQGMVHRDIKPQNLMLTRQGVVKILDFGLARLTEENIPDGVSNPNFIVGTPDYLAPEQANDSHNVDTRADIYALGCSLFFLLTKSVPFPKGSAMAKLVAHVSSEPQPITDFRSDLPDELVEVIRRMMAKRREDRYQTPAEVAAALAPFIKRQSTAVTAAVKSKNAAANKVESESNTEAVMVETPQPRQMRSAGKRKKRPHANPWGARIIVASLAAMGALLIAAAVERFSKSNPATTQSEPTKERSGEPKQAEPDPQPPPPPPPDHKYPPDSKDPPDMKNPPEPKFPLEGKEPKYPPPNGKEPPPKKKPPKKEPGKDFFPGKKDDFSKQ